MLCLEPRFGGWVEVGGQVLGVGLELGVVEAVEWNCVRGGGAGRLSLPLTLDSLRLSALQRKVAG